MEKISSFIIFAVVLINVVNCAILGIDEELKTKKLFALDIIHYNDFHARYQETSVDFAVCETNNGDCLGGFARLYYEIMLLRKQKPNSLLLDAGDVFQGTFWYTLMKGNVTEHFINMLPNDAHAIGNHEFDDKVSGLMPYLKLVKGPVLAANINYTLLPEFGELIQPYTIVERNGQKIGIIGVTTTVSAESSSPEPLSFTDPIKSAKELSKELIDQGIKIIVLLSHCGLDVDKQIAEEVSDIDVIVGGHTHSLLWNGTAPSKETVAGPYPIVINPKEKPNRKVVIVTASAFTKYLGNLTVYFNKDGDVKDFSGAPIFLNRSIPEDANMKTLLKPYTDKLNALVNEVVAHSDFDLSMEPCGKGECLLGELVAESFLDATKELKLSTLPHIAIILRNHLRASIEKGDITRGSLINTLPFTNDASTFVIKGKYLIEFFGKANRSPWTTNPFDGRWIPSLAGMRLTLNVTDSSVVEATVQVGDTFVPLDNEADYQVTVTSFLLKGGDGFEMIRDYSTNKQIVGGDYETFEKYLKKVTPIKDIRDQRLVLVV